MVTPIGILEDLLLSGFLDWESGSVNDNLS